MLQARRDVLRQDVLQARHALLRWDLHYESVHPMTLALAGAIVAARAVLAVVFALAGIAKLGDPAGTGQMLRAFGLPRAATGAFARLLPLVELAVAIALVPSVSGQWGALAAAVLLVGFTAAIVVNLMLGRKPECRCFGQVASAPIGPATLVRNVVLLAMAALAAFAPATESDPLVLVWLGARLPWVAGAVVLLGFFAIQTFLMLQILRQQGRMLLRLESIEGSGHALGFDGHANGVASHEHVGLPFGTPAPEFELPTLDGKRSSLGALLALERRVVLLFAHPSCGPCEALLPEVAEWQATHENRLTLAIVSEGAVKENRRVFERYGFQHIVLQDGTTVSDAYQAYGTPAAVVVEADGQIGSGVAAGADAIRELVASAAAVPVAVRVAARGEIAPAFSARSTAGETVESAQFKGQDVALLFWSPDCGFCRAAVDDVVRWDREVQLAIVSAAEDEELTARGLRARLLIDESGEIGRSFGASGTPMAVRIAADGTIASEVAAGKDAIETLLRPDHRRQNGAPKTV
jgi:peroxiredoxin